MAETGTVDYGAQVDSVEPTTKERILKGIGGAVAGATGASSAGLDAAIEKHQQARLSEARMHRQNASTYAGILASGHHPTLTDANGNPLPLSTVDPKTGHTYEDEYQNWYNSAMEAYKKAAGVNKETKGAIAKAEAIAQHIIGLGRKQREAQSQGGAGGTGAQPAGLPPPPQRSGTEQVGPGGGLPLPEGTVGGEGLTPPPGYTPQVAMGGGALAQQVADRRALDYEEQHQKIITRGEIERDTAKTKAKPQRLQAATFQDENGNIISGSYDPSDGKYIDQNGNEVPNAKRVTSGMGTPKPIHYKGSDGQAHFGYQVPGKGLFTADMQPLPPNTPVFSAWMEPQQIDTWSWKEVTQPDGSIQLVPVETKSTRTRGQKQGGGLTPPPSGASSGAAKGSSVTPKAARPGGVGKGVTVGGKVPPGVQKAYDAYNGSQERYNVMQEALGPALKGDQQAMINLLSNHMGMTMGLQKGARLNQALIEEAQNSAPALGRISAKFDKDGYLMGVVLTPDQMRQMIDLAKTRLAEDYSAYEREVGAAKKGYGMTGDMPSGPSAGRFGGPPRTGGGGPAPKTWDELKKQAASQAAP